MGEVRNPLFGITEIEYIGDTGFAKKILCKLCSQVVYSVPDKPKQVEVDRELSVFRLHFELQHNIRVAVVSCGDPRCGGPH